MGKSPTFHFHTKLIRRRTPPSLKEREESATPIPTNPALHEIAPGIPQLVNVSFRKIQKMPLPTNGTLQTSPLRCDIVISAE
jgi:hypothetical protein